MTDSTGSTSSSDFYTETAEYVAALLVPAWQDLAPVVAAALEGLDPAGGPVVDVGAGSGVGTTVIARAVPESEIVAVEPDRALRTALLATVAADPQLRRRVTVLDSDLLAANLPARIGGLVAMNVLGHFSSGDRARIWQLLAERLAQHGRAVLNLQPPHTPQCIPATPMAELNLGRRRYTGTASATPASADAVVWEMSYQIEQDGQPIRSFRSRQHWFVLTPDQLARELQTHGLQLLTDGGELGVHVVAHA